MALLPKKREGDVVVASMEDELLVYDTRREKAHHLNRSAAIVWRCCDGKTDMAKATETLARELRIPVDAEMVAYALERLDRAHLLEEPPSEDASRRGLTRRELIQKLAIAGAAAVFIPVIVSLVPPSAAQAAGTCVQGQAGCKGKADGTPCYKKTPATGCTVCSCWGGQCKTNSNHKTNCNT